MSKANPEHIQRLTLAVTYYLENLPRNPSVRHEFVLRVARRFNIRVGLFREAIRLLSQLSEGE